MAQTYRQFLQSIADNTTGDPNLESRALLASVGDDQIINPSFTNQKLVNGQYNAGNSVNNYNPDTGHINIDNVGFGPQGVAALNDIYSKQYAAANAPRSSSGSAPVRSAPVRYAAPAPPPAPVGPTAAQTDPLLASLKSLDTIRGNKNQQTQNEYNTAINGYNSQDALDKANYDKNVFANENTFTGNNQASLLNAANAYTGLRGVLSSLGGLSGSGVDTIKRLVGLAANSDTGAARKTFDANAGALNDTWGQAERQQRQRRADASATRDNNLQNNEANVLTSRQHIYEQLANLYGAGNSQGNDYASQASALAAPIAATTKATVAPYEAASSLFSPGALQNYLAGTQNLNVNTSDSSAPINSPAYVDMKKKDKLSGVA